MNLQEIVLAVEASGATVRLLPDGRATLVGSVPEDVLEAIRANRDAFLEAWEEDRRSRYLRCPPPNLLLRGDPPGWRRDVRLRMERYALRQGEVIARWVLLRAEAYKAARAKWSDSEAAAAALSDLIQWQWAGRHAHPERVLEGFGEVLR